MSTLHIVILAAGSGTRMRSTLPKVLHHLAGKPLLQHVIDTARGLQPATLSVVYGFGGEKVKETISDPDIFWVHQEAQLGTGHALKCAASFIGEGQVLVLYGDVPLISLPVLTALIEQTQQNKVGLLTEKVLDPTGYGRIARDKDGKFCAIIEHKDADEAIRQVNEINTGIAVFPASKLHTWLSILKNDNAQQEYYLTDVFAMAVAENTEVICIPPSFAGEAQGINNKQQLAKLERLYQQRYAERLLIEGVTLADPNRLDIRGELLCAQDVTIDVNVVCEGRVILHQGVKIGPHCVLKNVEIAQGVEIAAFSHIDGAVIGAHSRIGPFARVRPETILAENVHVGNFVEIKKSTVQKDAKINHLTYIGDARIGEKTNVGAGTVTCNYDGVNKSLTTIGANVFIGSGSMLVAPLNIGDNATIGAGSTIRRDVPQNKLTLTSGKQITIEGWVRPSKKPSK